MNNRLRTVANLVRKTKGVWPHPGHNGVWIITDHRVIDDGGFVLQVEEYERVLSELRNAPRFDDHPDAKCFVQGHDGKWLKNIQTAQVDTDGEGTAWVHPKDGWRLTDNVGELIGIPRDTLIIRPRKAKVEFSSTAESDELREAFTNLFAGCGMWSLPGDFSIGYREFSPKAPVAPMVEAITEFENLTGHELTVEEGELFMSLVNWSKS